MLHGNKSIIKHKIGLLNLANELRNVPQACRIMGLSRDTFYRCKAAVDDGGVDALIDRGPEYCGKAETHDYQLYLAINDIDHTKAKAKSPQTNRICERFLKTVLQEFYQVTFRKKIYRDIEQLQVDLDKWLYKYNYLRTHQEKMCCGRTPMETLEDGKKIWQEKLVA
jgi:hypothetical protein